MERLKGYCGWQSYQSPKTPRRYLHVRIVNHINHKTEWIGSPHFRNLTILVNNLIHPEKNQDISVWYWRGKKNAQCHDCDQLFAQTWSHCFCWLTSRLYSRVSKIPNPLGHENVRRLSATKIAIILIIKNKEQSQTYWSAAFRQEKIAERKITVNAHPSKDEAVRKE